MYPLSSPAQRMCPCESKARDKTWPIVFPTPPCKTKRSERHFGNAKCSLVHMPQRTEQSVHWRSWLVMFLHCWSLFYLSQTSLACPITLSSSSFQQTFWQHDDWCKGNWLWPLFPLRCSSHGRDLYCFLSGKHSQVKHWLQNVPNNFCFSEFQKEQVLWNYFLTLYDRKNSARHRSNKIFPTSCKLFPGIMLR